MSKNDKHDTNEFGAEEDIALDTAQDTALDGALDTPQVASEIGVTAKEEEARAKKKERADEWARMKTNLRNSKKALIETLTKNPDFNEQYVADLATLIGKERGTGTTRIKTPRLALRNEFINMFYSGDDENAVPEIGKVVMGMDLFMQKGLGKDKLNLLCAEAIKKATEPKTVTGLLLLQTRPTSLSTTTSCLQLVKTHPKVGMAFSPTK